MLFETDRSVEDAQVPVAVLNIVVTLLVGAGAAELGRQLGGTL